MQTSHASSKVLITGRSGSGKTTFWTKYVLNYPAKVRFIFDHEGEFSFRNRTFAATTPESLAAAVRSGWVVYDPGQMFPGRTPEAFDFFCRWSFEVCRLLPGTKLFACDELQKLTDTHKVSPQFSMVLETGRRYGLDAAMISQAPNLIHNRVRNQLTEVVAFQCIDANATDYLEQVGFDIEAVKALRPLHYIARNLSFGTQSSGHVSVPKKVRS